MDSNICIIGANACQDPAEDWTDNSVNRFQNEEDWDSGVQRTGFRVSGFCRHAVYNQLSGT